MKLFNQFIIIATFILISSHSFGEWTNRYPKVEGQRHHIYLEGYEFPIISSNPKYPAESIDGKHLAFSAHGYIWIMDLDTNTAAQLTDTGSIDSRPRWSNDGRKITFVRDKGTDTSIVVMDLFNNESTEIDTPAIELDPEFSPDNSKILFSSSQGGQLAIWSHNLDTNKQTQLTNLKGHSRNVRFGPTKEKIYFNHLSWPERQIIAFDISKKSFEIIKTDSIAGQLSFDIHPNKKIISYNWAINDDLNLITADLNQMDLYSNLTPGKFYAQDPSWSHDGKSIYYTEPNATGDWKLKKISVDGGKSNNLEVKKWLWKENRRSISIKTKKNGVSVASRLAIINSSGHPILNPNSPNYFDSQNGYYYFYSDGEVLVDVPIEEISIFASGGLTTLTSHIKLSAENSDVTVINLEEIWNPEHYGYKSADFHLHLNYDGPFRRVVKDIGPLMEGENLDIATPQAANLHSRLMDKEFKNISQRLPSGRLIKFAQEIRSHFHGHIGAVGPSDFYYPWYWGPGYPELSEGNKSNADVISFINSYPDSIATYVHPIVLNIDPFESDSVSNIPIEFIPNAILHDNVGLELVCAWSDELGTTNLWYGLLNAGYPVVAMAGTDMFVDFQRTPAIGSARIYAKHPSGKLDWSNYVKAIKKGNSFVTNGPIIELTLNNEVEHGDIIEDGMQSFSLKLSSTISVEHAEIVINGIPIKKFAGVKAGETIEYKGSITIPKGGWVAARTYGGETVWPAMDSYPFAHTSPIWINYKGSTEPSSEKEAKEKLIFAMQTLEKIAVDRYKDDNISNLLTQFSEAKAALLE